MIIEVSQNESKEENKREIFIQLSSENKEEEKNIRNAKILHTNNLLVWWGNTLELEHSGKFVGYNGMKMCYTLPLNPDMPIAASPPKIERADA